MAPGAEEFCICGQGYRGAMVACDHAAGCLVEWFHFECVQLIAEVSSRTFLYRVDIVGILLVRI